MAVNAFLVFSKPATVPGGTMAPQGETRDKTFQPLHGIELRDFSLGIDNPTTIGSATGGAGAGKARFQQLQITKVIDTASPDLLQACGTGMHFPQVDLYIRKAGVSVQQGAGNGKNNGAYLIYNMSLVYITDITWNGGTGDEAPTEQVTLTYGALRISYFPQDATGALSSTPLTSTWNQVTNTADFTMPGNS